MIVAGGGTEKVRCASAKFRELVPVLTTMGAALRVKGDVN